MKIKITEKVSFLIIIGLLAKLFNDTVVQMFNPFLVVFASGIGISTVMMGSLIGIRSMVGLVAPVLGALADRSSYKVVLQISLFLSGLGLLIASVANNWVIFLVGLIISGFGQAGYTPNLHAYLSAKLPYEKRARGLGIVEYAWALAGIVGLFSAGFLIEAISWRAPFVVLGVILILFSLLYSLLPKAEKEEKKERPQITLKGFFHLGENRLSAWAAIGVHAFNFFAMMHIMLAHGIWLTQEYNLSPSGLGTAALVFGLFDWTASITVSLAVDKIGKKRSVTIGTSGMLIAFVLLPFLNKSLWGALVSIAIARIFFEFAIVSNLPLMSEQVPHQRGKVMSIAMSAGLVSLTIASLTGPILYSNFGVWGLGPLSLITGFISLCLLIFFVKDHQVSSSATQKMTD